jgi:copper transport protein
MGTRPEEEIMGAMPLRFVSLRLLTALAAAGVGLLAILFTPAAPASAHAALVRTSPSNGAVVQTAPAEVIIVFSEPVQLVPAKIRVIAPDHTRADLDTPRTSGGEVHIPLRENLPRGSYLVTYRVISTDGHPVGGGITFAIGAPSPGGAPTGTDIAAGKVDRVVQTLLVISRYLGFAGLALLVGALLVLQALWPARLSRRGPTRLGWLGAGLITASTVLELYLQAPYTSGAGLFGASGGDFQAVLGDRFGQGHLVRLGVLGALAFLLPRIFAGQAGQADRILAGILGVIGVITWPLAGHPGASPAPTLTTIADLAHLIAMSVWLGGLVMLALFLLRQASEKEIGVIMPVWSRWAALAVSVLVLGGTAQALVEIGSFGALFSTTYGWVVVTKVLLLCGVLAAANYSRRWVNRHTAVDPGASELANPPRVAISRLRRAVLAEVAIIAIVLGCAAALVQTTPARNVAEARAQQDAPITSWTLTSSLYSLQVDVDPGTVGLNLVHLYAYTLDGKPLTVQQWSASASLPAQEIEAVDVPLIKISDDHASGQVNFLAPGDWQLTFTLRISEIDEATVGQIVRVNQ